MRSGCQPHGLIGCKLCPLERIAVALERIAAAVEKARKGQ
jgi:hypothetical protein